MKFKLLGSVLVFALVACSHPQKVNVGFETPDIETKHFPEPAHIRNPAQQTPMAQWEPTTTYFRVTENGDYKGEAEVQQVMTWTEKVPFKNQRNVEKEVSYVGSCSVVDCPTSSGGSASWKKVFTTQNSGERIKNLAEAVKGLGPVSAEALIKNGYLRKKPATWTEFTREVQAAADRSIIRQTEATKTIETYQADNVAALGFNVESCRVTGTRPCTKWQTQLVTEYFTDYRAEKRRKVIGSKKFNLTAHVQNAVLQNEEVDSLSFLVDEKGQVAYSYDASFNRYIVTSTVNGSDIHLNIEGASRNMIRLPGNVVRQDDYRLVSGKPTFTLDIDPKFLPSKEDTNSQLVLSYEVQTCEYGGLFGTCGISSWSTKEVKQVILKEARTTLEIELPVKTKSQIRYKVSRQASIYYNDMPTTERETTEIKTAKR